MAIDRPGAIEPHPRRKAEGPKRSGGRQAERFFASRGMPAAGVPARLHGVARQGKKANGRRCGHVIEAQPALGQIRPSAVRVARPDRDTETGGNRLQDARGRTYRARKDLRWRTNGGALVREKRCKPISASIHERWFTGWWGTRTPSYGRARCQGGLSLSRPPRIAWCSRRARGPDRILSFTAIPTGNEPATADRPCPAGESAIRSVAWAT